MNPHGELKQYFQAVGDAFDGNPNTHLEEETLIALQQNRLSFPAQQSARSHLHGCEICAFRFEDVQDFFDPLRDGEEEITEFETRQQWRDLRGKLPFEEVETPQIIPSVRRGFFFNSRVMMAVAACLMLTTAVCGIVAFKLWQDKRELQAFIEQNRGRIAARIGQPATGNQTIPGQPPTAQPAVPGEEVQVNTPIYEITAYDTVRTHTEGRMELLTQLSPKIQFFTVTLNLVSDSFPTYAVEMTDLNGKPTVHQTALKPNERAREQSSEPRPNQNATLTVSLPRQSLTAGKHLFQVYGEREGQKVLLEALNWSFQ